MKNENFFDASMLRYFSKNQKCLHFFLQLDCVISEQKVYLVSSTTYLPIKISISEINEMKKERIVEINYIEAINFRKKKKNSSNFNLFDLFSISLRRKIQFE